MVLAREIYPWADGRCIARYAPRAAQDDLRLLRTGEWLLHTEPTWASPNRHFRDCPGLTVSNFRPATQVWRQFPSSMHSPRTSATDMTLFERSHTEHVSRKVVFQFIGPGRGDFRKNRMKGGSRE